MEEYDLGKIEVMSSSLIAGSIFHGRVPQRQRELFQRQYSGGSNPLTPTIFHRRVDRSLVAGMVWDHVRNPRGSESLLSDHLLWTYSLTGKYRTVDPMSGVRLPVGPYFFNCP